MSKKFKILCLHGYMQNASRFSEVTGSLRKILKSEAEFHYLSAPHKIPGSSSSGDDLYRTWWFTNPNGFSSRDESSYDKGLDDSLLAIEKYFMENGPFDGILGFSQGACLTGLLCALKQRKEISIDFQFVIIMSGFKSGCLLHSKYYDEKLNINSLHVIGETDQVITPEMSYGLTNIFINPVIMTHPGGHYVPGRSTFKSKYVDFLTAQRTTQVTQT